MDSDEPRKITFRFLPDYDLEDTMNDRLVALARFEQFIDDAKDCQGAMEELLVIKELAENNNEPRVVVMADLVLHQVRKYLSES